MVKRRKYLTNNIVILRLYVGRITNVESNMYLDFVKKYKIKLQ